MGTNYYFTTKTAAEKQVHIGKCVAIGNGEMGFIWAIHPQPTLAWLHFMDYYHTDTKVARTENGELLTARELAEAITKCRDYHIESIGHEFS